MPLSIPCHKIDTLALLTVYNSLQFLIRILIRITNVSRKPCKFESANSISSVSNYKRGFSCKNKIKFISHRCCVRHRIRWWQKGSLAHWDSSSLHTNGTHICPYRHRTRIYVQMSDDSIRTAFVYVQTILLSLSHTHICTHSHVQSMFKSMKCHSYTWVVCYRNRVYPYRALYTRSIFIYKQMYEMVFSQLLYTCKYSCTGQRHTVNFLSSSFSYVQFFLNPCLERLC